MKMLIEEIEKATNGKIKITFYHSEQLGKFNATLDMLNNGIADMALISQAAFPSKFNFLQGVELPMFIVEDSYPSTEIREELIARGFNQGWEDLHFVAYSIQRPQHIWSKTKIAKAEDFKGLKIRWPDPITLKPFEQFGLVPVAMSSSDEYMSLERGVIDGKNGAPELITANKYQEVVKYGLNPSINTSGLAVGMSKASWDKIPVDLQTSFNEAVKTWRTKAYARYEEVEKESYAILAEAGVEMVTVDAAEVARWQQAAEPVINQWITDRTAEGYPAQEFIDTFKELASQYQ